MKSHVLISQILLLCLPTLSVAQQPKVTNRFELEADPIAFVLGGYSLHVGHTFDHIRVDIGTFGIKQPDFALSNHQFSVFSRGVGAKVDYLLQGDKGLFVGVQSDYVTDWISLKTGSAFANVPGMTLGLRTGYRLMLGKAGSHRRGLYLVPWLALLSQPDAKAVQLDGQTYQPSAWSIFPTLHLGYRF